MTTSRKSLLAVACGALSAEALSLAAPARPAPVVSGAPLASSDQLWENYARTADMVSEVRWLEDQNCLQAPSAPLPLL